MIDSINEEGNLIKISFSMKPVLELSQLTPEHGFYSWWGLVGN
jgi:hypothetical protein